MNQATVSLIARAMSAPAKPWPAPWMATSPVSTPASSKAAWIFSLCQIGTSVSWSPAIKSDGASRKFLRKVLDKVGDLCGRLRIDSRQFSEGMRVLYTEGKLHEMLSS